MILDNWKLDCVYCGQCKIGYRLTSAVTYDVDDSAAHDPHRVAGAGDCLQVPIATLP